MPFWSPSPPTSLFLEYRGVCWPRMASGAGRGGRGDKVEHGLGDGDGGL